MHPAPAFYPGFGAAWTALAVVPGELFIVLLFRATYYGPDVFVYYAVTLLVPVGVSLYLVRARMPEGTDKRCTGMEKHI